MAMEVIPTEDPLASGPTSDIDGWQAELATYLRPTAFPARQDDLLALLIRKRAPSRLLWRVAQGAPGRAYQSIEALCQDTRRTS